MRKNSCRFYWAVLKDSATRFLSGDAMTYAAALAFYMVFSLPPILLIVIWTAGIFYNKAVVREALISEFTDLVGVQGAQMIGATLERLNVDDPTWWASAIAAGTLLFTASVVLRAAKKALNRLFTVAPPTWNKGEGLLRMVLGRVMSLTMLIVVGFMFAVSMALDALLALFGKYLKTELGSVGSWITVLDSVLLRIFVMTFLFAMLFRYLSDLRLQWRDTAVGALLTALLFTAGGHLIGSFIGRSSTATYYDAAGGLLVLMLWVYYASLLFLFGATFTYSRAIMSNHQGGRGTE